VRILIVSQYFWPENFRINDLATALHERGHEVTVFTGKPNYPTGKYFSGYTFFGRSRESYHGVDVLRIPLLTRGDNRFQLALNYLWFALLGSLLAPFRTSGRYDAILVFGVSPITQALPALVLKALGRGAVHIWLLDLWPDSLSAIGAVRSNALMRLMRAAVGLIHRYADLNLVSCAGFTEKLEMMGVHPDRIHYFPNFAEDIYSQPVAAMEAAKCSSLIPPGFRVMFAGNIGQAQDFPTMIGAADLLRNEKHIQWIVVGDGRALPWVKEEVARRGLGETFHLVGRVAMDKMPQWFAVADAMLVTLRNQPIFALTIPGKIQSYMAASKPIIAALDGEPASVVNDANCGFCVSAGDTAGLAKAVLSASRMSPEALCNLGRNGRKYFDTHFERQRLVGQLEEWLQP
jgi:glycosyltransferase involved in cell wall biosynthesis